MPSQHTLTQKDRLIDHLTHHGLARAHDLSRRGIFGNNHRPLDGNR